MWYRFLRWFMPRCGYNPATCNAMLHNQWQHKLYLWGFQSYETYASKDKEVNDAG